MRFAVFLLVAVSFAAGCARHGGEFRCDASTADSWLARSQEPLRSLPMLPRARVFPVASRVNEAVARLQDRDAVELTPSEAAAFIGSAEAPPMAENGAPSLRPWLVRAVFPTSNPILDAAWRGEELVVFADGLGCAPFVKHPVIVWLDRAPASVIVIANADL